MIDQIMTQSSVVKVLKSLRINVSVSIIAKYLIKKNIDKVFIDDFY
jgi:hypothetical protein